MTRRLPTGNVTFLLTDVQGSTKLWEKHPYAMRRALARHEELIRATVTGAGGVLLKARGEGDSTFSVFEDASNAFAAALGLQLALAAEAWPAGVAVAVRAALHTGVVEERDGDYLGRVVNRAARLRAIAHGGQTIASAAALEAAAGRLPDGASARDLGLHRLKDLNEPERVYQLSQSGLAEAFPPLNSLDPGNHNLPLQLTSFIGREREIAELRALLARHRHLTLVGPGGAGKTRLSLQIAAEVVDEHEHGVWLVDLAPLAEQDLVIDRIASLFEVSREGAGSLLEQVVDHLRERRLLVVLDNCEHLADECSSVVESLLTACRGLRIISTSREPLRVPGEVVWHVPPLSLAGDGDPAGADAVQLFLDRAATASSSFRPARADLDAIGRLCARLDGMPLAIELAGARVGALTPAQIEARLDDRFRILGSGPRAAHPRHQTLRATLDWSHELLSDEEQTVFRRLAVFGGSFSLEAVEAVCGGDSDEVSALVALVAKSLVVHDAETGRYRFLETMRLYAGERLSVAGETDRMSDRLLGWAVAAVEQLRLDHAEAHPKRWAFIDTEMDNFRACLDPDVIARHPSECLRLVSVLGNYWWIRGHYDEAERTIPRVLEQSSHLRTPARAAALYWLGHSLMRRGGSAESRSLYEQAVAIYQELRDDMGIAVCVDALGWAALQEGDLGLAGRLYSDALGMFRELRQPRWVARGLNVWGEVARLQGDFDVARARYEESIALARAEGLSDSPVTLSNLATIHVLAGRPDEAAPLVRRALSICGDGWYRRATEGVLMVAAAIEVARGRVEAAALIAAASEAARALDRLQVDPADEPLHAHVQSRLAETLSGKQLERLSARGASMSLEEAVALASEDLVGSPGNKLV